MYLKKLLRRLSFIILALFGFKGEFTRGEDNGFSKREKLMVKLSYIAYCGLLESEEKIKTDITEALSAICPNQKLVWGPAVSYGILLSDAMIYIVQTIDNPKEYTVVFRGTNPFSLFSWITEDFIVDKKLPWIEKSPFSLSEDAQISRATSVAFDIHSKLIYPNDETGESLYDFLKTLILTNSPVKINFTGHSLGGVLSSTFALWFDDMLNSPELNAFKAMTSISVYSFAGPSAGDIVFADYSDINLITPEDKIIQGGKYCTRYKNTLDLVPNVWNSQDLKGLYNIYDPKIPISEAFKLILDSILNKTEALGYTQPKNCKAVTSDIINLPDINESLRYILEAAYQHTFPYVDSILDSSLEKFYIFTKIIMSLILSSTLDEQVRGKLVDITRR